MDTQSTLCLGMHSNCNGDGNGNGSSATRTPIADDSISLQISSSCRDPSQSASSSIALQFLEQQPHNHNHSNRDEDSVTDGQEEEEDVKDEEEEFSILGHSVCLKRRRDADSSSATSTSAATPSKKMMNESSLEARRVAVRSWGNQPLCVADPVIFEIMEKEKHRQVKGIELIASENFVCRAVMEALGSHLTNKYSEGMPGARYYGGNQYIDQIELLCCKRALEAFHLDSDKWGVNVQPYSCTSANFAVYTGLLNPKDRIMGLDTPSGGHLSHGYYTPSGKKVAAAAIFFESLPYKVNPNSGYIDYDKLEENALNYRPKILICGGSSYPREWDYARFRQIADKCGAVLMCDMAHISGLVAGKVCISPFDYCDIVTSTTHKSLRGPRGGIVFFRKGLKPRKRGTHLNQCDEHERYDFEEKISFAVFPSLQGGPHNNHIAALAIALKQVATPEYHAYMQQVKKNAQALACALIRRKCRLVTGGTDNHLVLWDLRTLGLTVSAGRFSVILAPSESFGVDISTPDQCVNGFKIHMENINVFTIIKTAHELSVTDEVNKGFAKLDIIGGKNYEKVCEICHITLNKSAIFGDNGTVSPGGVRIGTPAMTSRGCLEADFETMADFLMRAAQIASIVQREHGKSPKDFLKGLQTNKDVGELRNRVESFASLFAMPAFDI